MWCRGSFYQNRPPTMATEENRHDLTWRDHILVAQIVLYVCMIRYVCTKYLCTVHRDEEDRCILRKKNCIIRTS
ncbi:hypothetical protein BJX96DRAFT_141753 [Aspergillus floccosus]